MGKSCTSFHSFAHFISPFNRFPLHRLNIKREQKYLISIGMDQLLYMKLKQDFITFLKKVLINWTIYEQDKAQSSLKSVTFISSALHLTKASKKKLWQSRISAVDFMHQHQNLRLYCLQQRLSLCLIRFYNAIFFFKNEH